jgi:hypothetical protein
MPRTQSPTLATSVPVAADVDASIRVLRAKRLIERVRS